MGRATDITLGRGFGGLEVERKKWTFMGESPDGIWIAEPIRRDLAELEGKGVLSEELPYYVRV